MDDCQPVNRSSHTSSNVRGVLLTGATGLLGQYLLHDLLLRNYSVTVLVRDSRHCNAVERITRLVNDWSECLQCQIEKPKILIGDLGETNLGLTVIDQSWIGRHCQTVLHSAANLSFRETAEGEPRQTNVNGTASLLDLCQRQGVSEWHQVSTAFVCGKSESAIIEDKLLNQPLFHNIYEKSKFDAEQLIRRTPNLHTTYYRPSVIVGDSRTGHTSNFNGLYRFLELATLLASKESTSSDCSLPLRLPLSGNEAWNLVTVDWVSQAIVELLGKPKCHGQTYHLISRSPVATREIYEVAIRKLNLRSFQFAGPEGIKHPTRQEQMFLDGIHDYWPYLRGNPVFSDVNTRTALPDLPPTIIDRTMLERLIHFAVTNQWGRKPRRTSEIVSSHHTQSQCSEYIEITFPQQARKSKLGRRAGLDLTVCIDVKGTGGGQWACKWSDGELVYARRGLEIGAAVTYHMDASTFDAVINKRLAPQEAFFEQRIAITGDMEIGLKMAFLFWQFLEELPNHEPAQKEVMNVHHLTS